MRADDAFLDQVVDRALRAWAEGEDVDASTWVAERPDLRAEIEAAMALAREVALVRPAPLPQIAGYRLVRELGRGGMGVVYLAEQVSLGREVAVKVLPDAALSDRARQRFLTEARALGRLVHPHVVAVYEVVDTPEFCAFSMEWVRGTTLARALQRPPDDDPAHMRTTWLCRIAIVIARALHEVHRHGLVHRDVKPSNILLREDGTPLLSDFGLVREETSLLTHSGQFVGTPGFSAPEQLRGEHARVGVAADVFGLGATLHYAFAGRPPFAGRTPHEVAAAAEAGRRTPLTDLGLARDLDTIVGKCLEAEPGARYADAAALADDLERLLELRPIRARRVGVLARSWKLARRNRRALAVAAVAVALVLALLTIGGIIAYREWTLPERVAALVRQARFARTDARGAHPPRRPRAAAGAGVAVRQQCRPRRRSLRRRAGAATRAFGRAARARSGGPGEAASGRRREPHPAGRPGKRGSSARAVRVPDRRCDDVPRCMGGAGPVRGPAGCVHRCRCRPVVPGAWRVGHGVPAADARVGCVAGCRLPGDRGRGLRGAGR